MSDAELQRKIDDELAPTAQELARDAEAAKQRLQKVINELSPPLREKNQPALKLHLKTLDGLMGDYARLVSRGQALLAKVGALAADDERSPAAKALATLAKTLGEQQGRLERNWENLNRTQAEANKVLGEANSEEARVKRAWVEMEAFLDSNRELYKTRLEQVATLEQAARAALAERDTKDLAKLQARNEDRKSWKPTVSEIDQRLINFFALQDKALPQALKAQFTSDRVAFNKTFEALQATDKKIEAHYLAVKALAIKPIDAKKAADAMEIPKGNEARVKKALESGSLADGLDALAKELKLKGNGSDLFGKLKKAKLL